MRSEMARGGVIRRLQRFKRAAAWVLLAVFGAAHAPAQGRDGGDNNLKFNMAPVELVLQEYAQKTGRTLLLAPTLPTANINLRSEGSLTREEYLEAIETVLGMNGIALLPEGEKFIRVVPNKEARVEPMPITIEGLERAAAEDGAEDQEALKRADKSKVISQMIALKFIEAAEAQKSIQPLLHSYAQVHLFEGINSMLITDTIANINRVLEVIAMIDQPIEAREEPIIVPIRYAKASEIKARLEEIIAEQQEEEKSSVPRPSPSGPPGVDQAAAVPVTPPGVIRARRSMDATDLSALETAAAVERGVIQGKVKIVADDRTNILILIMRPENMPFFEKIIQVLDVETSPDVMVRVFRLEFAEAKDISSMLNELIGAAAPAEDAPATTPDAERGDDSYGEGSTLRDFIEQRREAATPAPTPATGAAPAGSANRKSKVGELSKDNIKILSDERTNSLIIMASRGDLAALEEIIKGMDMMLSQVLVEAVIVEVNLDDTLQTGVDWVQRTLLTYNNGPAGTLSPKVAYGGGGGGGTLAPVDPTTLTTTESFNGLTGAGLTYYLTMFDLNIDMVLKAVATDSRTRILSSPVILTTDNKEATIEVTQATYFFKGQRPVQAGNVVEYTEDVEREDVGIKLTVTPRINEKRYVVMEVEQALEDITGSQRIGDTDWPIVTTRKVDADVAVRSGDTIVLGGLVKKSETRSKSGIPLLGDIPILGFPFRSKSNAMKRQEVIVFLTPYVLNTPEEMEADAVRRQDAMGIYGMWKRGWSNSRLAEPRLLGQVEELGSARGELGYTTNAPVRTDAGGPRPFRSKRDSLFNRNQTGLGREVAAPYPAEPAPEEAVVAPADLAPEDDVPAEVQEPAAQESEAAEAPAKTGKATKSSKRAKTAKSTKVEPVPEPATAPAGPAAGEGVPEPAAAGQGAAWDPMEALDPELRKYVEQEDKKWDRSVKKADQKIKVEAGAP